MCWGNTGALLPVPSTLCPCFTCEFQVSSLLQGIRIRHCKGKLSWNQYIGYCVLSEMSRWVHSHGRDKCLVTEFGIWNGRYPYILIQTVTLDCGKAWIYKFALVTRPLSSELHFRCRRQHDPAVGRWVRQRVGENRDQDGRPVVRLLLLWKPGGLHHRQADGIPLHHFSRWRQKLQQRYRRSEYII